MIVVAPVAWWWIRVWIKINKHSRTSYRFTVFNCRQQTNERLCCLHIDVSVLSYFGFNVLHANVAYVTMSSFYEETLYNLSLFIKYDLCAVTEFDSYNQVVRLWQLYSFFCRYFLLLLSGMNAWVTNLQNIATDNVETQSYTLHCRYIDLTVTMFCCCWFLSPFTMSLASIWQWLLLQSKVGDKIQPRRVSVIVTWRAYTIIHSTDKDRK